MSDEHDYYNMVLIDINSAIEYLKEAREEFISGRPIAFEEVIIRVYREIESARANSKRLFK